MNDLTEQWDKGKLPSGDYYIKIRNGEVFYDNIDYDGVWRNSLDEDIVEVLAPVPSYDEIKLLQEQIDDLIGCLIAIRDRGCEKDFDCILSADITLQKWGVK